VNVAEPAAENLTSLVPVPKPALDRAGLLSLFARAASSTAAGTNDSEWQRGLDGRQFEIRIRFGCDGPSKKLADSPLGWSLGDDRKTLRLRAAPTVAEDDPLVRQIVGEAKIEAAEGFWIPRPWLLDANCPAAQTPSSAAPQQRSAAETPAAVDEPQSAPDAPSAPAPVWPRIGLAQFYVESDSRTGRRDQRAYESVKTLDEQLSVGAEGFNLVLSGRLKALPGRQVIQCAAANPDSPPECLVSAEFDQVWIETPSDNAVIAQWSHG
jgi:hypothetical protein